MAEPQKAGKESRENPVIVTARRALGINKYYFAIAIIIGLGVLFFLNPTYINISKSTPTHGIKIGAASGTGAEANATMNLPLLAVPFSVVPMMMLTTPMVILFVYDKNNGVLEYLLSLGMTQRRIYSQYLKAAVLIAVSYLLIFGALNLMYSYILFGAAYLSTMVTILGIGTLIAVSTVAFIMTMMMAFSSLQKSRAGGNQPLAMTLGIIGVIPGYIIPFAFPFQTAILVEFGLGVVIALASLSLLALSSKMIKREKFLP